MRACDHYTEAEQFIERADTAPTYDARIELLAAAQAHATLALAGATALQSYARVDNSDGELADWEHAAGGDAE